MYRPNETEKFETATLINTIEKAVVDYGNISLEEYIQKIKGCRIHRCPKCLGRGYLIETYDAYPSNLPDSGFAQDIQERKVMCDICKGVGYTEKKMVAKRRVIIDGYEEVEERN